MNPSKIAVTAAALIGAVYASSVLAAPVTYTLDPNHSFVHFGYEHMGFSHQQSRFNKVTGTVTFDSEAKTGAVDVTVDMTSVDTGSILNDHIQRPEFFDTAQFPTATFKSTAVKFDGDQPVSVDGDLTIKGMTHPVTLTIEHFKQGMNMQKRQAMGADATAHVSRKDFGMGANEPMVGDDVAVTIDFEAGTGGPRGAGKGGKGGGDARSAD